MRVYYLHGTSTTLDKVLEELKERLTTGECTEDFRNLNIDWADIDEQEKFETYLTPQERQEILDLSKTQLEIELEKTYYTHEEWNVYKKIIKNMELENIKNILDYKLASKEIDEKKYKFMCNNIYLIQETYYKLKFEDNNENISMADAINKMIKENKNGL